MGSQSGEFHSSASDQIYDCASHTKVTASSGGPQRVGWDDSDHVFTEAKDPSCSFQKVVGLEYVGAQLQDQVLPRWNHSSQYELQGFCAFHNRGRGYVEAPWHKPRH